MTRSTQGIKVDSNELAKMFPDDKAIQVLCAYVEELCTHIERLKEQQDENFRRLQREIAATASELSTQIKKSQAST